MRSGQRRGFPPRTLRNARRRFTGRQSGGVSCLAGVVLFGNINGFICNYVGICIGSAAAFALARHCGRPLILKIFGEKQLRRYDGWTQRDGRFDKLFALAIFLPAAPDDFLCYLAGTTAMSWKRFTAILLLGKPLAILMYSTFLGMVWKQIITWIG